jgi:hypothetical protein
VAAMPSGSGGRTCSLNNWKYSYFNKKRIHTFETHIFDSSPIVGAGTIMVFVDVLGEWWRVDGVV